MSDVLQYQYHPQLQHWVGSLEASEDHPGGQVFDLNKGKDLGRTKTREIAEKGARALADGRQVTVIGKDADEGAFVCAAILVYTGRFPAPTARDIEALNPDASISPADLAWLNKEWQPPA